MITSNIDKEDEPKSTEKKMVKETNARKANGTNRRSEWGTGILEIPCVFRHRRRRRRNAIAKWTAKNVNAYRPVGVQAKRTKLSAIESIGSRFRIGPTRQQTYADALQLKKNMNE